MKSILKATAVLSSASFISVLMGLVLAKVSASLLGPEGVGLMGLLQSLVGLAALVAGMGVGAGLVRAGAKALAQGDEGQVAALGGGAWLLCWTLGGLAALLLVLLRAPLSRLMLGGEEHSGAVVLMAPTLLLTLATLVQTSMLNAHHRIGDLARVAVKSSVFGTVLMVFFIWRWRAGGIAPAILAVSIASWAVSYYYLRRMRAGGAPRVGVARRDAIASARELLSFGAPYTASMVVGGGVQLILPALVLHTLGHEGVGFYRASTTISVTYLGFLINAMAQDYYPRISAASDDSGVLARLINDQLRLVLLLSGPIILGMLALVPYIVPLVYSARFAPTSELLEWQLIGDIFKFAAWTMSFVILARSGSRVFFITELFGGSCLLLTSWFGMRWFGLSGLGVGFILTCAFYLVLCWGLTRRSLGLRWTTENKLLFLTFALAATFIRALPYVGLDTFRTPVALALAGLLGLCSLYIIWRELGSFKSLKLWRKTA
ncbi:MAG TPA: oligosaccharide flippase family protein [Pyrinomonadaceae bacterium]|nr:oligosaccharide flippase family protein [Pyrinomonadaceae bacterium]